MRVCLSTPRHFKGIFRTANLLPSAERFVLHFMAENYAYADTKSTFYLHNLFFQRRKSIQYCTAGIERHTKVVVT